MRGAQTPRMTPGPVRMDAAAMIQQSCTAPTTSQLLQKIWFALSSLSQLHTIFRVIVQKRLHQITSCATKPSRSPARWNSPDHG